MRIGSIVLSTCSVMICGVAFADDSAVNRLTPGCVTVNFTGEVVEAPCVVSVGNANSVDLGRIKKVAGKKGRITPDPFYLTDCKGVPEKLESFSGRKIHRLGNVNDFRRIGTRERIRP